MKELYALLYNSRIISRYTDMYGRDFIVFDEENCEFDIEPFIFVGADRAILIERRIQKILSFNNMLPSCFELEANYKKQEFEKYDYEYQEGPEFTFCIDKSIRNLIYLNKKRIDLLSVVHINLYDDTNNPIIY